MLDKSPTDLKQPPAWVLLLVAIGFPAAAVSQLQERALAHPWLALGLLACWCVLVGIGGFALKVWGKREPYVLAWFDEQIDRAWLRLFSGRRRVYLKHVADKCMQLRREGTVKRRAWSFRLDEVFVDLCLVPKAEGETGTAIVPLVRDAGTASGRLSLWNLLDHDAERPLRLAILGGPGTGKTTLLDHVALRLAGGKGQPIPGRVRRRVPVLIALRSHASRIVEKPDLPLSALVEADLPGPAGHARTAAWVCQQLESGRAIVMTDGLDEVASPAARKAVAGWVGRQMLAFPRCTFILTSRPGGYRDNPIEAVELVAEVERFTAPQIRRFALQWFLADTRREEHWLHVGASPRPSEAELERRVRARAPVRAEEFLGRLRGLPALDDFAGNPLLLRMMAEVHAAGGTLGERRADLYGEIMTIALGRRREAKGLALELGIEQMLAVAQPLALEMLRRGRPSLPISDAEEMVRAPLAQVRPEMRPDGFLRSLEHDAGVVVQREAGEVAFAHLTYQEYLSARQLGPTGVNEVIAHVAEPAWRETVLFWAALHDATPIMAALLRGPVPTARVLELALRVEQDAKELGADFRDKLRNLVTEGCESSDSEIRKVVASALLARRVTSLRPVNEVVAIDDGLVTHAEYQLFLDECRAQNVWRQPDHWTGLVFPSGSGLLPVTGVRPSDALSFCSWLTERQGGTMQLRLPDLREAVQHPLAGHGFEINETAYWVSYGDIVYPDSGHAKYSFFTAWGLQQANKNSLPLRLLKAIDIESDMITGVLYYIDDFFTFSADMLTNFDQVHYDLFTKRSIRDLQSELFNDLDIMCAIQDNIDPRLVSDLASDLELAHDVRLGTEEKNLARSLFASSKNDQSTTARRTKQDRRRIYAFMALYHRISQWSAVSDKKKETHRASYIAHSLSWLRQKLKSSRHDFDSEEYWNDLIKGHGYACAASILIHRRIQGEMLPYEGIRIVRKLAANDAS